ncbi:unnamed protein product [Cunninghamella echinulata]
MWTTNRNNVQKRKSAPSNIISTSSSSSAAKRQALSQLSSGIVRRKDHSHSNSNNNNNNKGTNIQVVLRCRGRNEAELAADSPIILEATGRREVLLTISKKVFTFDSVFDEYATQIIFILKLYNLFWIKFLKDLIVLSLRTVKLDLGKRK